MKKIFLELAADENGQDLVEYALMCGFVAFAAGAIMPGVVPSLGHIYKKVLGESSVPPHVFVGDEGIIRIVCAGLAAMFIGAIVFRRRKIEE
ncbi:MAG: hypothetical protein NTV02_00690 [Candidatus Zambryskibacteria bacterium]|nr:hypothetical protein [Candidatus Zambryskibacteria bacterium]